MLITRRGGNGKNQIRAVTRHPTKQIITRFFLVLIASSHAVRYFIQPISLSLLLSTRIPILTPISFGLPRGSNSSPPTCQTSSPGRARSTTNTTPLTCHGWRINISPGSARTRPHTQRKVPHPRPSLLPFNSPSIYLSATCSVLSSTNLLFSQNNSVKPKSLAMKVSTTCKRASLVASEASSTVRDCWALLAIHRVKRA